MACTQTLKGITRDCLSNSGGVRSVWLANKADIDSIMLNPLDGAVTLILMKTGKSFYEYQFARGTASMSSNYAVNAENGTKYVETDLVMVFARMNTAKRNELISLKGAELAALVEDQNGKVWLLGHEHPLEMTAGDGLTGTAYADRNGYSITLHDVSPQMPREYTGTMPPPDNITPP